MSWQECTNYGGSKGQYLIIENGDVVELTPNSIQKGDPVKAGVELLDNSRNGIVDARVLKERQQLAGDGVVTVLAPISTDGKMVAPPRVNLRGVVTTAEPRKMSMWTEREISWVLENRWKQLSRQTGPNNFEVDWIGVQREIENGLSRRMRRELQVEPLILCLVQPAPSGTRAYIPKITEEQNFPIEIEIIIISIRNQTIIIRIVQITHKIPKKVQKFHRIHQLRLLQKIHLKVEQEEEDLL